MKIYTRTGDDGGTALFGGGRVPKNDPRVAAYGEVDELNAWIGVALTSIDDDRIALPLADVQQDLFVVGAFLATPNPKRRKSEKFDLPQSRIDALETQIDDWNGELPELTAFILPGGVSGGAMLHASRTVCRRAERSVVGLGVGDLPDTLVPYLNRLSDWLFVCARVVNHRAGVPETIW